MEYTHIKHTFQPVFDKNSRVLILGTLPSAQSRLQGFYYGHPQNRFWSLLAGLYCEKQPNSIAEKTAMLLRNHVAIWDVVAECDICGSSDSSIKHVVPTDIVSLLKKTDIQRIYTNGKKAGELYAKYQQPLTAREAIILPSTSPANAAWRMERLKTAWSVLLE